MAHTYIHVVVPSQPLDMAKVELPPYIGTQPSSVGAHGVTLITSGAMIEDGVAAIRSVYPDAETFDDEHEAARRATDYAIGAVVLQPVHLGTGEQGKRRKIALEKKAAAAGFFWGGKPSIGRWLISLADAE